MADALFSQDKDIQELVKVSNELYDIAATNAILDWDQNVNMPVKGGPGRAFERAMLSGLYHEKLTRPAVGKLLNRIQSKSKNIYDAALVREIGWEYEKAVKIPKALVEAVTQQASRSFDSWRVAKEKSDFAMFAPDLEKLVGLKVKEAKILQKKGQPLYDVFMDDYEPGLTEVEVGKVFGKLQPKLTTLAKKISQASKGAAAPLEGKHWDFETDKIFCLTLMKKMGFDFEAGRLDTSPHPFTTDFGSGDVRITTYHTNNDLEWVVFGVIHETGHALYSQGHDAGLDRTHLANGTGLGMHESQSRFWENIIGRSPEFWQHFYPEVVKLFPAQLKRVTEDDFVRAVNVVRPSLIRVGADEVTYGLHIILRFDIERELVNGKVAVKDLPKLWSTKMKYYLGVEPLNDREGVLQDVHWSQGLMGYFPTYLLGTMMAAQEWQTVEKEIPNIKAQLARGELLPLREWLRAKIHRSGRVYRTNDLLKQVTGESLDPEYFLQYLKEKFNRLYPKLGL